MTPEELIAQLRALKSTLSIAEAAIVHVAIAKLEAARRILEPMQECDPQVREWLGKPCYFEAPAP